MHGFTLVAGAAGVGAGGRRGARPPRVPGPPDACPLGSEQAAVVLVVAEVVCAVIDDAVLESPDLDHPRIDLHALAPIGRSGARTFIRTIPDAVYFQERYPYEARHDEGAAATSTRAGPTSCEYRDVADPEPGPLDVVVDVAATALNHLDVVQRNGWFTLPGFTLPHIAGMDLAGTVVDGRQRGRRRRGRGPGRGRPVAGRRAGRVAAGRDGRLLRPARRHRRHRRRRLRRALPRAVDARPPGARRRVVARRRRLPDRLPHRPPRAVRVGTPGVRRDGADPRRRQRRVDGGHPARPSRRGDGAGHGGLGGEVRSRQRASVPTTWRTTARSTWPRGRGRSPTASGVDMVLDHVGPALWEASLHAAQAARPARQLRQHDRRLGDDPVARPPVPHGDLDHRLRRLPARRVRRRLAAVPRAAASRRRSTACSPSPTGRRRRRSCCATTSSARSSSSPEPPWPTRRTRS